MKVADLMTREARACTTNDSLNAAARIMWDHDCGCVPVVEAHGKLAGIVTDRDVAMAAYTQGLPLGAIPVERAMSARVVSCERGDDIESAHRLMRRHEIHRLPVVDSRGRLIGILSLSDLVSHASNGAAAADAVEVLTTLAAVGRHREPAGVAASNGDTATPGESTGAPKKKGSRAKKSAANLR